MGAGRGVRIGAMVAMLLPPAWTATAQAADAEPAVRVVFNTEPNPPSILGGGTAIDPERPGLVVELLRRAAQRAGVALEFQRVPWQRGLYMIETGQADAIFMASFNAERTRYGVYPMKDGQPDDSRRLHRMSYSLFVRKGSDVAIGQRTITGLRAPVGAAPEFAVVPMLRDWGVTLDLDAGLTGNLRKLASGRIDAYAEIDTLAEAAIRAAPQDFADIVKLTPPLRETPYFLMFSKTFHDAHPEIAERVWDAIAAVRTSPEFRARASAAYAD